MSKKMKEKLVEFNRNNILEAAERLFSEKGVKETTMDDISKAADYSKSTIYVYFKSKEEIYNHIIFSHMCHLRETIDSCVNVPESFEKCYFQICHAFTETYEQYPFYFESIMGDISVDETELSECGILRQIYDEGERINDGMLKLFEKGVREKYLREDIQILPAVFMLWASLVNTIKLANQKEKYIVKRMGMSKPEFLEYSFGLLIWSIKRV